MATIERSTGSTGLTYEALVEGFERELGHWSPATAESLVKRHAPWSEVEQEAAKAGRERGLMIIQTINQGAVTSLSGHVKKCRLYLVGNPAIATHILDIDPAAGFYVPFRVCLYDDGGPGGASLTYDRPSSFLAALGRPELDRFGALLDGKIDDLAKVFGKVETLA